MNKKPYSDDRWKGSIEELNPDTKPIYRSPEQIEQGKEFMAKLRKFVKEKYHSNSTDK